MGTQEYIVFGLAGFSVVYLMIRFIRKANKKKSASQGCSTDCDCH